MACMEDVLDLYQQPFNEDYPVICMDEKPYQLLNEARIPIPMKPGKPERRDSEYVRHGTCSIFILTEPLAGWRHTSVRERRTSIDWAHEVKELLDVHYPDAVKVLLTEDEIKSRFLTAFNSLMSDRDGLIEDCRLAQGILCDTKAIDAELAELHREIEVVTELSRKAIYENAQTAVNQTKWGDCHKAHLERHRKVLERVDELEAAKRERLGKAKIIEGFIRDIESRPLVITEFDEKLWLAVIDQATVGRDGTFVFRFRTGSKISA